jgi:serine/threonine protein phosphatase PrpC
MRKDNSEFVTEFVSDSGNFKKNRDYFAYVERDNMACWVLGDGLDSDPETLSAEIVAKSVINDFTANPSMKRRHIKKYIKNANKALLRESGIIKLQSTVLVVVSNYNSIRWGSVGNTRLYNLRKGRINLKSKDHSIAQMMVEADEIEERKLNQHQERNNLTKYLGHDKRVKPYVSKKFEVKDDDILLMCTSGFWENSTKKELKKVLKDSTEAKEFVDNLEDSILSKGDNNLDNYSMVSIFINKAFKENKSKKGLYKKIASVLVPILILTGGFTAYTKVKKAKQIKITKLKKAEAKKALKLKELKKASTKNNRGDKLFKEGKYANALTAYEEASKLYEEFKQIEKAKEVKRKIDKTETLMAARDLEEKGDDKFNTSKYKKALSNYKEAKLNYLKIKDYNVKELEQKIARSEKILEAINYEREGDMFLDSKEFLMSKSKYSVALEMYKKNGLFEKEEKMNNKIEQIEDLVKGKERITAAQKLENEGNELFKLNDYKNATLKYMEAKVIYSELGITSRVKEIKEKIDKVNITKFYNEAKGYEDLAEIQLERENYSKAIFNYGQAKKIYTKINKEEDSVRVENKITDKQQIIEAHKLEEKADRLFKSNDFKKALSNYKQASKIYNKVAKDKDCARIEIKIVDKQQIIEAMKLEAEGNDFFETKEFENANLKYKKAKSIYLGLEMPEKVKEVKRKIEKVKEKKKKFLFFF